MTRIPDDTIAAIKALRAKGHSIREICGIVGLGTGTVHRHAKGIKGVFGKRKAGRPRRIAVNACRQLRTQGLKYREIAARLGCSVSAVHAAVYS